MKYIAAYLLAQLGGNASPSCEDLKDILSSVGAEADDSRISHLLGELDGRDIVDVIAEGKEKFASVPAGGAVAAAPAAAATAAAAPEAAKEAPKQEEPQEESDEDMGLGLFD